MADAPEPEAGDPRQHLALAWNGLRQDHVKGRQTIAGNDQEMLGVDPIEVAHLAAMQEFKMGEPGFVQG
jgi:hypothetical protein